LENSVIKSLPNTTISKVSKALVTIREEGGAVALGRVLTLIIETDLDGLERAVKAANDASREHPCRVIVLASESNAIAQEARLDAEIRVGGDAGERRTVPSEQGQRAVGDFVEPGPNERLTEMQAAIGPRTQRRICGNGRRKTH
jgi:hypothetical protein